MMMCINIMTLINATVIYDQNNKVSKLIVDEKNLALICMRFIGTVRL